MFHTNINLDQWSHNLYVIVGIVVVSVVLAGFIVNWIVDRMVD